MIVDLVSDNITRDIEDWKWSFGKTRLSCLWWL